MREIKFKAWIKDSEDVEEKDRNKIIVLTGFDFGDPYGDVEYEEDGEFYCIHHKHCKVMQWTRLKDKNNKEIYFDFHIISDGMAKAVVHWNSWSLLDDIENGSGNWEIIGNIYENPELIK